MLTPKFTHNPILTMAMALALGGFFSHAFAQGVFEGSGEEAEESSSCVGDGCGLEFNEASNGATSGEEAVEYGTSQDTVALDSAVQDSAKADTAKIAEIFDDEDSRPDYYVETADEFRARKEGFSKSIQFGFRAAGGVNLNLLGEEIDGWNVGMDLEFGAIAKLPLGNDIAAAVGLDFGYRTFSYEADTDYGHNEAKATEMLFEIPAFVQYSFDDEGFFMGLGFDVSLKMHGETEFKQTIDTKEKHQKDKRNNTMPTAFVGFGGLVNLGYAVSRNFVIDLRLVQNITNLLYQDVIAESTLAKTKLLTSHATLGFSLML